MSETAATFFADGTSYDDYQWSSWQHRPEWWLSDEVMWEFSFPGTHFRSFFTNDLDHAAAFFVEAAVGSVMKENLNDSSVERELEIARRYLIAHCPRKADRKIYYLPRYNGRVVANSHWHYFHDRYVAHERADKELDLEQRELRSAILNRAHYYVNVNPHNLAGVFDEAGEAYMGVSAHTYKEWARLEGLPALIRACKKYLGEE